MRILCRCDNDIINPTWGFKEEYQVYKYNNKGYIQIIAGFDGELFTEPMYLVEGKMTKVSKRLRDKKARTPKERVYAISQTVKAKDVFYSNLQDNLIVQIRLCVDFAVLDYDFEKAIDFDNSFCNMFEPIDFDKYYDERTKQEETSLYCTELLMNNMTEIDRNSLKANIKNLYKMLAASKGDKVQFIYDRCIAQKQKTMN